MIKEVMVKEVITFEYPPDGGKVPIIDPYDGCTIDCPYCFQQVDDNWNRDLYIKKNIPELIREKLSEWPKDRVIYIGSRCDPYQKVEETYELTKKCIVELDKLEIPIMIVTKSHHDLLIRDIEILKNYSSDITVLLGFSNLKLMKEEGEMSMMKNIKLANRLYDEGVNVWGFITPVLCGITDVEKIIENVAPSIPIFLDKLRIEKNTTMEVNMIKYIENNYPDLINDYRQIVDEGKDVYIDRLREIYAGSDRVKFVFD